MSKTRRYANGRHRGSNTGTVLTSHPDAGRKTKPCVTCGAKPGFSCNTVVSVQQVAAGKPGAYLKPMRKLHSERGRS